MDGLSGRVKVMSSGHAPQMVLRVLFHQPCSRAGWGARRRKRRGDLELSFCRAVHTDQGL
jgi:hypothetical protein